MGKEMQLNIGTNWARVVGISAVANELDSGDWEWVQAAVWRKAQWSLVTVTKRVTLIKNDLVKWIARDVNSEYIAGEGDRYNAGKD